MPDTQSKTLIPMLILHYLEENTDEDHPASREQIEEYLDGYGLNMERKAFFRHIEHLNELEWVDIRRTTIKPKNPLKRACAGFYCNERLFNNGELRIMMDALSGSRYLSQWETADLIARLASLSTKRFQRKIASYQFVGRDSKTENHTLFYNLEIIDEAMAASKQISFDLLITGKDGKNALSEWTNQTTSPVRYFVKEQSYYLVGIDRIFDKCHIVSYDLSMLANMRILDRPAEQITAVPGYEQGINWEKFLHEHPSLENLRGKPELCTFHCSRLMLNEIRGHFGSELRISPVQHSMPDGRTEELLEVSVITDPYAAMLFAWNHPAGIWLIAPASANAALRRRLESQLRYYDRLQEQDDRKAP